MNERKSNAGPSGQQMSGLAAQIRDHLKGANALYNRLTVVVGEAGAGKTTALYQLSKEKAYLT
jgi:putative ribosome biogenesis GTPase RsgA